MSTSIVKMCCPILQKTKPLGEGSWQCTPKTMSIIILFNIIIPFLSV